METGGGGRFRRAGPAISRPLLAPGRLHLPPSPYHAGFQAVLQVGGAQVGAVRDSLFQGAEFPMETQPTHPPWKYRPCAYVCVFVGWGWGRGAVSFSCPRGAGEGCRHQLPAPHDDANLAPATLFCFCHILGGFSHPPPSPQFLRLPVCHLFINFVLREQMARAELGRMYLLPLPYNSLLEHTAHRLQTIQFLAFSDQKLDFSDRPHIPGPCLTPDPAQMKPVPRSLLA